ncbi:MAG TPA: CapA family protein [Thiobacillaceae bacterium]|nr:CapA family protein [Thiobacillaceae bacterium]
MASPDATRSASGTVTLFLSGDVMTGRGIDQILPHPGDPRLYESYVKTARAYVQLAEEANGPFPQRVGYAYPWGDALAELERRAPAARIVNLETAVTARGAPWPGKGIHYRMQPANVPCLSAAKLDCCIVANNHILDWGPEGLADTLAALRGAGIQTAGAGSEELEAARPAVLKLARSGRVLVYAWGTESAGVPADWAAGTKRPGVNFLPGLTPATVSRIASLVRRARQPGDLVVVSLHWGSNWGYAIPDEHRSFAHALIDEAGADVVYGHSSHHPRGIEVYRGRPILYGCGDLINDYEGIRGYEMFRSELALLYFPSFEPHSRTMRALSMVPLRRRRLRLEHANGVDSAWLQQTLDRECRALGCWVELAVDGALALRWQAAG